MTTASTIDFLESRLLLIFAPFGCNDYMVGHYIYVSIIVIEIFVITMSFIQSESFLNHIEMKNVQRGKKG
jgi:hypothetical protein